MTNSFKQRIFSVLLCICMLFAWTGVYRVPVVAENEITPKISVGNGFMVALASDGTLYAWGSNFAGMLGNGTNIDSAAPVKVTMPVGVRFASVSAGWNHVIALSTEGRIYTWGSNAYGQLGSDAAGEVTVPKEISFPVSKTVVAVAAGNSFSLALTSDGEVYAWGLNSMGQLGVPNESLKETKLPQKIEALSEVFVTSIEAGNTTAAAISAEGKVWLWGDNANCQCGSSLGDVIPPTSKIATDSYFAVGVALGDYHSSLVELNGSVKSFGTNRYGQFGNGSNVSNKANIKMNGAILPEGVVASYIAAGSGHCLMIDAKGEIYSFGDNRAGQLGYESEGDYVSAPQKVVFSKENAKAISLDACENTSAMVDSNGLIWTWGANDLGQLGNGSFVGSATPVGVRGEDGERLCLGRASYTTVYQSSITVNATVPPPSYSIEIPSGISVGELRQTTPQEDGSHIVSAEIEISVKNVDHLFGEKMILVTVNTESGKFELADGEYRLPYAVYGALGDAPLMPGEDFAIFTKDQSAMGRIEFDQSLITREGSYSGRLIFETTVSDLVGE